MTTPVSEVNDLFLQLITDYRLIALYTSSATNFETFLESWLLFSITDFGICDQSLDFNTTSNLFTENLTLKKLLKF